MARYTMASIPFCRIPNILTVELIYSYTFWINFCCFFAGVLNTIRPCELLSRIKCHYSFHVKFKFGDYLQAYHGMDNTTRER